MSLSSMSAMIDQKPPLGMSAMSTHMNIPSSGMPIHSSHQFHSFNPATGFVMAPTAPPGLLHLSKCARVEKTCSVRFLC